MNHPKNHTKSRFNNNLWQDTLTQRNPSSPLSENIQVETAVIGGGVTGLSTALHLAENGMSVALFEAHEIAHFASGRNGGQIVPGVKPNPDALVKRFGEDTARRMLRFCFETANITFDLINRYSIDCQPRRTGWVQGAFSEKSSLYLENRVNQINKYGGNAKYLNLDAMQTATGSKFWPGGVLEQTAGSVQPLAYVRGLADAAISQGVAIYEKSPVIAIQPKSFGALLTINGHTVKAKHVVLATDAYTGKLWPSVTHSYVTVSSAQISTKPLPADILSRLMPLRAGISETRKITYYCRIDPEGRFVIGGRGHSSEFLDHSSSQQLRKAAITRFPELEGIEWPYGWACRVGMTMDDLPRIHELAPGIWTAYGYCGRGMAMGTAFGQVLCDAIKGLPSNQLEYPITPISRMPFYPLRQIGANAVINWYRLCDTLGFPQ